MKLVAPSIHYLAIAPELALLGGALLLLFASALRPSRISNVQATVVTAASSIAVVVIAFFQWSDVASHGARTTIDHAIALDGFSIVASAIVGVGLLLSTLVAHDWAKRANVRNGEFSILALAASSGAVIMAQANDLVVIFIALEILSIGLYVLVAFDRHRAASSEAALKYFLMGGFASAVFIYGAALVYGATGTTNLSSISYFLGKNELLRPGLLIAGGALLLVGFSFKVAAAPFHSWAPDVYQGAPSPVTGFMASIVKVGAFAAFVRVLISALGTQQDTWRPILWVLIVLTTFVGAGLALVQRDAKRLLAYSSINHAGFMLLGLWAGTVRGAAATLYYLITYAPLVIATFAIVTLVGGPNDTSHAVENYRGLARRQPWLGGAFAILLLAQAGAPFTTGFFAKFSVLSAAVDAGGAPIAIIAMVAASIAFFFYLRWTLSLYAEDALDAQRIVVPWPTALVISFGVVTTIVFGIWVGPFADLAHKATLLFLP